MRHSRSALALLAIACAAAGILHGQAARPPAGTLSGVVSATTVKGDTIRVPNVLVHLWRMDAATEALRDSACAAWKLDRASWLGAKQELLSPMGMDMAGTQAGRDLHILRALVALPHDTTRTGADGAFAFRDVADGGYTLEAEVYANDTFMQWSRTAVVLPQLATRADLSSAVLSDNQFCGPATGVPDGESRVYDARELDAELKLVHGAWGDYLRNLPPPGTSDATIEFTVSATGVPDGASVVVHGAPSLDFERAVAAAITRMRFAPPLHNGHAVAARGRIMMRATVDLRRMPVR